MKAEKAKPLDRCRARVAKVVEVGAAYDLVSRFYDILITAIITVNLAVSILSTFDSVDLKYGPLLDAAESVTIVFFLVDYLLRLFSAKYLAPRPTELGSLAGYIFSVGGIVDLLSFLPALLPVFFPDGAVAFRVFRIIRIFRLFRINVYYDSLNAITEVLARKKQQLESSVFIILVLMLGSSLCMYSVEHEAQPEVFQNAFSGLWWSVSTLLTVGYGDIYPITPLGKLLGIVISFLGVGMVAIPTGIISAGFVEQYSRMQEVNTLARELELHFIKVQLRPGDLWNDKTVAELRLPEGMILGAIHRGKEVIVPRGNVRVKVYDTLVLGAEPIRGDTPIRLKELVLLKDHPWSGKLIRDLDLPRESAIILIKRKERVVIPRGNTRLQTGDNLLIHSKMKLSDSVNVEI